jgi:phospholipase C
MANLRNLVDTVVLVMMENRSFDHMLGHLSLEGLKPVDGLKLPITQFTNVFKARPYHPFSMQDGMLPFDPPHDSPDVAVQLGWSSANQRFTMGGFVKAFADKTGWSPGTLPDPLPMGYFPSNQVPVTSFLAQNFAVCDRWFSPIPTSTQPNRTLAFCGSTGIAESKTQFIPFKQIIFQWLEQAKVRWRVYHDGLSFFALYGFPAFPWVFGPRFRRFERLAADVLNEPAASAPQVVIVEPSYADAPHVGSDHANDNHAPLAVGFGENFLRDVYHAVTASPEKWKKTVMVLYYDEHGGFWDHVPPPPVPYVVKGEDGRKTFKSMGPRIPAIVISPLVERSAVFSDLLDHTSVLQFLAELFTPGTPYPGDVAERAAKGVRSLSSVLTRATPTHGHSCCAHTEDRGAHAGGHRPTGAGHHGVLVRARGKRDARQPSRRDGHRIPRALPVARGEGARGVSVVYDR